MPDNFDKKYKLQKDVIPADFDGSGWISISISKNSFFIYYHKDSGCRIYYIGRVKGPSAKLHIKFIDQNLRVRFNSHSIVFQSAKKYFKLKEACKHFIKNDEIYFI